MPAQRRPLEPTTQAPAALAGGAPPGLTALAVATRHRVRLNLVPLQRAVFALDVAMIVASVALAWPFRALFPSTSPAPDGGVYLALVLSPFLVALWLALLTLNSVYSQRRLGTGIDEYQGVAKGTVAAGFATSTACYFGDIPLSRGFLLCAFTLGGVLLITERYAVRRWIGWRRTRGRFIHRVLAIGSQRAVVELARVLEREPHLGYEIVGCTVIDPATTSQAGVPAPLVGSVHDVRSTCRRLGVDTVMVAGGAAELDLRQVAWDLEGLDVDMIVVPHLVDVAGPRLQMRPAAGLPLLHVEKPQASRAAAWPKRAFDVVGAAVGLLLISPLLVAVAALIKMEDGGPALYRQTRVGRHGQVFSVWKFRSMSVEAEAMDAQLRAAAGHEGALFKLKDDPRVTRIGRFIRRYSIDELPQLVNVLGGSMSLVGPRPQQQYEVDTYSEAARRRLSVRPGMTGLWQVSGRSHLSWDDAIRLDLYYRDNWSMIGDFAIIAKTVQAVLRKEGAY